MCVCVCWFMLWGGGCVRGGVGIHKLCVHRSMSSTQLYPEPTEGPASAASLVAEVPNTDENELRTW